MRRVESQWNSVCRHAEFALGPLAVPDLTLLSRPPASNEFLSPFRYQGDGCGLDDSLFVPLAGHPDLSALFQVFQGAVDDFSHGGVAAGCYRYRSPGRCDSQCVSFNAFDSSANSPPASPPAAAGVFSGSAAETAVKTLPVAFTLTRPTGLRSALTNSLIPS